MERVVCCGGWRMIPGYKMALYNNTTQIITIRNGTMVVRVLCLS